jgi:type IV pilus assembly protein PilA
MVRRVRGFTLIELMIVVAIIGILAAIAIPNFLKFQCKSKQSEAKTNLSGIFTAEKAFFGEYTTYSTDLMSINWKPDGSPAYVYGFIAAVDAPASTPTGIGGTYNPANHSTDVASVFANSAYKTDKMKDLPTGAAMANGDLLSTSMTPGTAFRAGAAGDPDADAGLRVLDQWTIDQFRTLVVQANDCSN